MLLRSLRYYHELLQIGYRCALRPDPIPRTLRGERIALGIDQAELDTIPLCATRRSDGAVAIPMVGCILESFDQCVDAFCAAVDRPGADGVEGLREARRELRDRLAAILPQDEMEANLARLADIYVPAGRLQSLCGPDGLLQSILTECEMLLAATTDEA